jgi:hypothetical protein
MERCDLFIAVVNSSYKRCNECNASFMDAIESQTQILKLCLDPSVGFNDDSNELVTRINVYEDRNQLYLAGIGQTFISIVHNIQKQLPKCISQAPKASTDLLVISTKSFKSDIVQMNLASKVKFLYPDESFKPDLVAVRDAKVILAVINDDVNNSEKSIEESLS